MMSKLTKKDEQSSLLLIMFKLINKRTKSICTITNKNKNLKYLEISKMKTSSRELKINVYSIQLILIQLILFSLINKK